jgi:GNAT superfamily N-acetyltransferase
MKNTMQLTFHAVSPTEASDSNLRADLLATWVAVTDAGGPVGFSSPAPVEQIATVLDDALARVRTGQDALGVIRHGEGTVGMGFLVDRGSRLTRHWRTVLRVMVHPDHQGGGAGSALMNGLHELGRSLGLEQLQLTIRDGYQLERFYQRHGYEVVGRHPGAVRVGPGDDRDEIMLVASL